LWWPRKTGQYAPSPGIGIAAAAGKRQTSRIAVLERCTARKEQIRKKELHA